MRCTATYLRGVSGWSWKFASQFVDFAHDPNMLCAAPQGSLATFSKSPFLRAERVFLDCDISIESPTKAMPSHRVSCDFQKHVNRALMQELLATFGRAKMTGISIDPMTNNLLHPPTLPCSIDEWGQMTELRREYNTDVMKAVLRTAMCLGDAVDESVKTKRRITATKDQSYRESINEGNVETLAIMWLIMSGFSQERCNGPFRLKGHSKRHFPFRGVHGVAAIPDAIVVQVASGDLVLIVEDKARFWQNNQGDLAQIFGEALCVLYHNYFTNQNRSRKPSSKVYAIRMYNHHASFFMLEATQEQVESVCLKKNLPQSFKKMRLTSDTLDPGCLSKGKIASRPAKEFLGWSLVDKETRFEAQWRMAKLREILS